MLPCFEANLTLAPGPNFGVHFIVPSTYTFPTPTGPATVTSTLGNAIRWPYTVGLNIVYRVRLDLEIFGTFSNITNHHYANVYDSTGYPAETFSGILGLRYAR